MKLEALVVILFLSNTAFAKSVVDLAPPTGFTRLKVQANSYAEYLRNLPIKDNKRIATWDGQLIPENFYDIYAVIGLPLLFNEDLEQCADFSMRLWAEYLKSIGALSELGLYDFYGNKKPFLTSNKTFSEYLNWHMKYSNSYSIKLGARNVDRHTDLQAGDMYVQNDSEEGIGHVSVIIDEAINEAGLKVYLVGYSYMPAQQFHIEKAPDEYGIDGWFIAGGYYRYAKVKFSIFGKPVIKRF